MHYFVNKPLLTMCMALFQLLGTQIGIKRGFCLLVGETDMQKITYNAMCLL